MCANCAVVLLVPILFLACPGLSDTSELQMNATDVWTLPGKSVDLPCDATPPFNDDVNMVFWYKDDAKVPFYSLDAREEPIKRAEHHVISSNLGGRSYFIAGSHPDGDRLQIKNVTRQDAGVFRCRVDFINSPTRNTKIILKVADQPPLKIFNVEGAEVVSDAGPFLEGQKLFLSCETSGGNPQPTLSWYLNDTLIDNIVESRTSSSTVNQLVINRIPRTYKGQHLECRASYKEFSDEVIRDIPIIVYLRPNKVKIINLPSLLSVQKTHGVRCETSGSYPPAKLTWLLDGKPFRNEDIMDEEDGASSTLSLTLHPKDDGKELVCRAQNPRFPGGWLEDRRQINVAYPPKVVVKPEFENSNPAREGATVILRCEASSRPSPTSFSWFHDGHLIHYNETAGTLPDDERLTLKNVARHSEGHYSCSAINSEGETYSAPYVLQVQYAPRCKHGHEVMRVGVLANESVVVHCHVDAIPPVTKFSWTYNTTRGVFPVQGAKLQNKDGVSTLQFSPGPGDLQSLSCWASNSVGQQHTPCLFFLTPVDYPESPKNCLLRNATGSGLEVVCDAGMDGGLQQSFVLEVAEIPSPALTGGITTLSDQGYRSPPVYRVLGETPLFRLHSLKPGREYQLYVFAVNAKGTSEPVILSNIRISSPIELQPQNQENSEPASQNLTMILVGLAGAAVLLIIAIVSVAGILACRRKPEIVQRRQRRVKSSGDDLELSEAGFGEGFQRRSAQYRASLYLQEVEANARQDLTGPDLILSPAALQHDSAY